MADHRIPGAARAPEPLTGSSLQTLVQLVLGRSPAGFPDFMVMRVGSLGSTGRIQVPLHPAACNLWLEGSHSVHQSI